MNSNKVYIKIILPKSSPSPSVCNEVSKMEAISQNVFHILIMNEFPLFASKTRPSAYFPRCIDTESELTLLFQTKENK